MEPGSQMLQKAFATSDSIKKSLIFCDHDALDTGMQKVQPLPFLDEEIKRYVEVIEDSVPAAQQVGDDVPVKVREIVETVIRVGKEGKTTLFKASDVLELTAEAYQYARRASLDNFQLANKSVDALRTYDSVFKRMIQNRIDTKVDEADYDKKECCDQLEKAVRLAEEDKMRLADRTQRETEELSESLLSTSSDNTQENLKDEKDELELIVTQCERDIGNIENELKKFNEHMKKTSDKQKEKKSKDENRLQENREEQRLLEEELRRLRKEEESLVHSIENGEHIREQLDVAREQTYQEIEQWKANIEGLKKRTNTALDIVHRMKECTDLILTNAKEKKREWKTKLTAMEVDNLCSYRDALVAQGVFFNMTLRESEANHNSVIKEIRKLEDEKKSASKTGFTMKVKELNDQVHKYTSLKDTLQKETMQMNDLLSAVKEKIKAIDGRLKELRPLLKLESLEDRYHQWMKIRDQAFNKESTSAVTFDSIQRCM